MRTSAGKTERILGIYNQLLNGEVIYKQQMAEKYQVDPRSIQRDIDEINCFLQEKQSEMGEINNVIYDRSKKGYRMEKLQHTELTEKEVLAVSKILLESRSMLKEEMFPILEKLLFHVWQRKDYKKIQKLLQNEMFHYIEPHHQKKVLERIWDIAEAVSEQRYVELTYQPVVKKQPTIRIVQPMGILFSEYYFYFVAFIKDIDREKAYANPRDPFPTIYRIDRILDINVLAAHFQVPYKDRFEEGEFRKRVQFMYGGTLRKVSFKFVGPAVDAVLDRLPTAVIKEKDEEGCWMEAEVFGTGIEMWLRSQGEYVREVVIE